jgi:hypothetical protein
MINLFFNVYYYIITIFINYMNFNISDFIVFC